MRAVVGGEAAESPRDAIGEMHDPRMELQVGGRPLLVVAQAVLDEWRRAQPVGITSLTPFDHLECDETGAAAADAAEEVLVIKPNASDDGMTIQGQSNSLQSIILETIGNVGTVKFSNDSNGTLMTVGPTIKLEKAVDIKGGLNISGTEVTSTAAELNLVDGLTGVQTSGESFSDDDVSLMTSAAIDDRINAATPTELSGVTAGTVTASKAVVVDSNKDIASFRNVTLTGELDTATLDVSGDADIDGTTNLDAVDIDGDVDLAGDLTFSAAPRKQAGQRFATRRLAFTGRAKEDDRVQPCGIEHGIHGSAGDLPLQGVWIDAEDRHGISCYDEIPREAQRSVHILEHAPHPLLLHQQFFELNLVHHHH